MQCNPLQKGIVNKRQWMHYNIVLKLLVFLNKKVRAFLRAVNVYKDVY